MTYDPRDLKGWWNQGIGGSWHHLSCDCGVLGFKQASIMTGTAITLGVDGKLPAEPIVPPSRLSPLRRNSLMHQNAHLHQGAHLHEEAHLHQEPQLHQGNWTDNKGKG